MPTLTPDLRRALARSGYYPELVADVLATALADEPVEAHLVRLETTFDAEIRRHVTALALTATRLVLVHVDDLPPEGDRPASASATSEVVSLKRVRTVGLTRVVADPARHRTGDLPLEVTLAIGWGSVHRIDLEPAACGDPACDADHGLSGVSLPDDLVLRVSALAEGEEAVASTIAFAQALAAVTG